MKAVRLEADPDAYATAVLRPNAKLLGPRLGKAVQQVIAAARSGEWKSNTDGTVTAAGQILQANEFELAITPIESAGEDDDNAAEPRATASVRMIDPEGHAVNLGLVVSLDVVLTDELVAEGRARDVVRAIQQARKDADFMITDRIRVTLAAASPELVAAIEAHSDHIASATLAEHLDLVTADGTDAPGNTVDIDGSPLLLHVEPLPS